MTAPLYAIGRFCSRHHWPTIAVWLTLAVGLVVVGQLGDSKTNDNLTLPGTGSTAATELLEDNLPEQAYGSNPLVFRARAGASLTESRYAKAIDETVKRLNAMHDVNSAVNPLTPAGAAFLGRDRSVGAAAYVGGQTAGYIDLATQISDKLPLMIAIVVGLSFVVLLLAFRSLLVPIKAAAMNLISVAAAYGIVTAVFQLGWGSSLIGLDHSIPIVSFVPLLMFAILFGLSMDYEVFLLTQIREHYRVHGDPKRAVIEGLANTGRVITSAAAIMVCVFTSFVLNGNPLVKEFGVGLAVAIAIDATLVRCLLVPAVMVLLGERAWWLPRWLSRFVPHVSIEGEDFFAKRDAEAAGGEA